jgi:hypothetical protein
VSIWLDTRGKSTLGIGWCDRCKFKFSLDDLQSDRNNPGLKVCSRCNDELDPYRLPPRAPDDLTLPFYRTQEPLIIPDDPPEASFDALATELDEPILAENGVEALEPQTGPGPDGPILVTEESEPILTEGRRYLLQQFVTGPTITAGIGCAGYCVGYNVSEGEGTIDNEAYYPGYLVRVVKDLGEIFSPAGLQVYISFDPLSVPAPPADVISSVTINGITFLVADAVVNIESTYDRVYTWGTPAGIVDGEQYVVDLEFT